ncbi:hypothetical protein E2K80_15315 [Rhodophyticola sp. CCM32]|uniref:hypothetical protein n=1 Tax=Rhodophyticola sp. CCM32 TaxID=2916397 RepID=UPI00107F2928|nr:hypothetical protein [Rhodophyticola sp. CCM32]QBY01924.1 hypothetical protein E2K80_15315 [Rhodophyticola sp. CCM32]
MTAEFAFVEVTREKAVEISRAIAAAGRAWHIHALHPGCRFNPRPEGHCFVVEDTDAAETYCAFSDQPFTKECHELVQLLHGNSILNSDCSTGDAKDQPIVKSAAEAFAKGEKWHHHMMKPGCVLSPLPSHYVITLEREGSDEVETRTSDLPLDDTLREIELLYFKQYD